MARLFAPAPRSSANVAELGDVLINTIVGLVLTAIVLGVGVPFLIHSIASGKTNTAGQVEANINTAAVQFYQDNLRYPSSLSELVPKYLPQEPTDSADTSPTPTGDFTLTPANDANGNPSYIIVGTVKHDPTTLNGLSKAASTSVPGTTPTVGGCRGGACSVLIYDPAYGVLGS
jgi:type II secretory pathway pseudopilin PulG